MKRIALAVLVFAALVTGQAVDHEVALQKLTASLQTLRDSGPAPASHKEGITKGIMALAEQSHRPSMSTIETFTEGLTGTLAGKQLSASQASKLATEIDTVMHSAGMGTWKFKEALSGLETTLNSAGANAAAAKKVAMALELLGKEIRGSEGIPARRLE
jgi:hypothetical protein